MQESECCIDTKRIKENLPQATIYEKPVLNLHCFSCHDLSILSDAFSSRNTVERR